MTSKRNGYALVTEGEKFEWLGTGKTTLTAGKSLAITYGVSTTVDASLSTKFSMGISTSVSLDMSAKVERSDGISFTKGSVMSSSRTGGFAHEDSYAGTVGAAKDASSITFTKLKTALWVLLGIQTAVVMGLVVKVFKVQADNEFVLEDVYTTENGDFRMSDVSMILTTLSSVCTVILTALTKVCKTVESNTPEAALTMDAKSGVFLGMNLNSKMAGMTMDSAAINLAIGKAAPSLPPGPGLQYKKTIGSSTIVGLEGYQGQDDGARLNMSAEGNVLFEGAGVFSTKMKKKLELKGESVLMGTMDGQGGAPGSSISFTSSGASLNAGNNSAITVSQSSASIVAGSFLNVTNSNATLGTSGSSLEVQGTGLNAKVGNKAQLQVDATGVNMGGGALTVLGPAPPMPIALQAQLFKQLAQVIAELVKTQLQNTTTFTVDQTKQQVKQTASKAMNAVREKTQSLIK